MSSGYTTMEVSYTTFSETVKYNIDLIIPHNRPDNFASLYHINAIALAELQAARVHHVPWQRRGTGGEEVSGQLTAQLKKEFYVYSPIPAWPVY